MSKGKFSQPRSSRGGEFKHKNNRNFSEEETSVLPDVTENPLELYEEFSSASGSERRNMPEVDFHSFEELNFGSQEVPEEPELSGLESDGESPDPFARFSPIPPRHVPTEEEAIEQAFAQAVSRQSHPSPRAFRALSGFWNAHKKTLLLSIGGLILAGAVTVGGILLFQHFSDPYDHLILSGVTVAGVDLGGMEQKQAVAAVEAAAESSLYSQDMKVSLPDQTLSLDPEATRISLDADAAVKQAYRYGRSGSKEQQEAEYRDSLTQTHSIDLAPFLSADKKYIVGQLEGYANAHNTAFAPSSYALEGDRPPLDLENFHKDNTCQTLLLIPGNPGFHLDVEGSYQEIMNAYASLSLSTSLELLAGEQKPEPLDLKRIFEEFYVAPVDSSMDPKNFDVIPGSYGYTFDLDNARQQLSQAQYGDTVRIPMEYVEPDIMEDEVYFQDVLSTAKTPHGKDKNRNTNLDLACKALDGLVLNPGDEFSYNDTLGQRTADKGYKGAPAYSGDKLVDSLGGGICQVSSTLYYSCLLADLEITDRINHGFLPSYIDPGMDATVSWGRPDFKFRNSSDFPIMIRAEATEDQVIVQILGTDNKDYYIKMEYEMSDSEPKEVFEEYDASSGYYDGQVVAPGVPGHYVKTYRCKYSKKTDVLISRELEARSSYMSKNRIIAVVKTPAETLPPVPETTVPPETQPQTPPVSPETETPANPPAPPEETPPPADNSSGSGDGSSDNV